VRDRISATAQGRRRNVLRRSLFTQKVLLLAPALLAAAGAAGWAGIAQKMPNPWYPDEFLYAETARRYATHWGGISSDNLANLQFHFYSLLISPAWRSDSMTSTYALAKAINAVLMTLGAVFVYLWARRFLQLKYALLALGLTLLLPDFFYSSLLITENAFFPAFLLALLVLALALERPRISLQLAALAATALASTARLQGLVLLAIIPTAVLAKWALDVSTARPRPRLRRAVGQILRYAILLVPSVIGVVAYVVVRRIEHTPLGVPLGPYGAVASGGYSARAVATWTEWHGGDLALAAGIIPAFAYLTMVGWVWTRRSAPTAAERSFVAVSVAAIAWLTLQAGLYATRFSFRMEERYLFHVAPLLLLGFAWWLARGLPRPLLIVTGAIAVVAGLVLSVPRAQLAAVSNTSDALSLLAVWRIADRVPGSPSVHVLLVTGMVCSAALFVGVPRRMWALLPVAVVAYFGAALYQTYWPLQAYGFSFRHSSGLNDELAWVDRAVPGHAHVIAIYGGAFYPLEARGALLQTEFWNRSIDTVGLLAPMELCCIRQFPTAYNPRSGRIYLAPGRLETTPGYAVATLGTKLAGRALARQRMLVLYRLEQPLRVASRLEGVDGHGWIGSSGVFTQYAPTPKRRISVTLSRPDRNGPDLPGHLTIRVGRPGTGSSANTLARVTAVRRGTIRALQHKTFTLPTPQPPFRLEIAISPTLPPDPSTPYAHQLGAHVSVQLGGHR
jgi:hypothetical protein